MDGMHRACKALIESKEKVKVVAFLADPKPDFNATLSDDD
jgi:hypothetical protein